MTREPSRIVGAIVFGAAVIVIAWRAVSIMYGFAN
jgi:hypothetical protein